MRSGWVLAFTMPLLALPLSARAQSANDQPYPVGERATGMGGAAVAVVDDGSAAWYNPGGLGRARYEGVSASVSVYGVQLERTRGLFSPGGQPAELGGWTTVLFPSLIGYVKPLDVEKHPRFRHAIGLSIVVPDYRRHQVSLNVPDPTFALSSNERLLEQTIWVLPGWGACVDERFCFGASLASTYRSSTGQYTLFASSPRDAAVTSALSYQEETSQFGAALQVGGQVKLGDAWSVGLDVRSPLRTLYGTGKVLLVDTNFLDPNPLPRRVSDDSLWSDFKLPLHLRAGAAYASPRLLLAFDLQLSLPQDSYAPRLGSSGADWIQPRAPDGSPVGGPIAFVGGARRTAIFNVNLGGELVLSNRFSVQAGAFTDLSGTPEAERPEVLHSRVNRFGISMGLVRRSRHSTSYLALVGTAGSGSSSSPTDTARTARFQTFSGYINVGASTDFGDPLEGAPSLTGRPLYERWWFWTVLGTLALTGAVVYVAASLRDTGVPPSDLGAQRTR